MEFMDTLLDIAYQTFALKRSYFDVLNHAKYKTIGIEAWAQLELFVSFEIRGIDVTPEGKKERDCDMIIGGYGVELRCVTNTTSKSYLLDSVEQHPEADLYLFLTKFDDKLLGELKESLREMNFAFKYRELNSQWMVLVTKRN